MGTVFYFREEWLSRCWSEVFRKYWI